MTDTALEALQTKVQEVESAFKTQSEALANKLSSAGLEELGLHFWVEKAASQV